MALRKLNKEDEEFQIFQDVYKLYQNFFIPEKEDSYWESYYKETYSLVEKYHSRKLVRNLILAITNDLEERYKHEEQN